MFSNFWRRKLQDNHCCTSPRYVDTKTSYGGFWSALIITWSSGRQSTTVTPYTVLHVSIYVTTWRNPTWEGRASLISIQNSIHAHHNILLMQTLPSWKRRRTSKRLEIYDEWQWIIWLAMGRGSCQRVLLGVPLHFHVVFVIFLIFRHWFFAVLTTWTARAFLTMGVGVLPSPGPYFFTYYCTMLLRLWYSIHYAPSRHSGGRTVRNLEGLDHWADFSAIVPNFQRDFHSWELTLLR